MEKQQFTWSYLIVSLCIVLLLALAYLQYSWLTQVSEAQARRLEDQIASGAKGFSTAFNGLMNELKSHFSSVSVTSPKKMEQQLSELMAEWEDQSGYSDIISTILVLPVTDQEAKAYRFDPISGTLLELSEQEHSQHQYLVQRHLSSFHSSTPNAEHRFISVQEMVLGDSSYVFQTVTQPSNMIFDHVQKDSLFFSQSFWKGKVAQGMALVILLNNSMLKNSLIPSLFESYFGESSSDFSYSITASRPEYAPFIVPRNSDSAAISIPIGNLAQNAFMVLQMKSSTNSLSGNYEFEFSVDGSTQSSRVRTQWRDSSSFPSNLGSKSNRSSILADTVIISDITRINRDDIASINVMKPPFLTSVNQRLDSTPYMGFRSSSPSITQQSAMSGALFSVYVSSGSVDALVTQTRIKNLLLSLGILTLLALAFLFIVYTARKAQFYAKQQMLFVAGISHELKTPISIIRSAAENVEDGLITDPERMKTYGALIHKEGKRLSHIVSQVFHVAGVETDQLKFHPEQIEVAPFQKELSDTLQSLVEHAGITLEIHCFPPTLSFFSDREALLQIMSNLVENAVKYRGNSNRVEIMFRETSKEVIISVKDQGIGIKDDDKPHIFKPFFRSEDVRKEQIRGNGLGLYLVKAMVEQQGGTIRVESTLGKGTRIILIFPKMKRQ